MRGYTQITGETIRRPSLDSEVFDPEQGAILECEVYLRRPIGIEEQLRSTSVLDFAAGELQRLEALTSE